MRLATNRDRIHGAGAEVIAISVDDEVRQAGMRDRWGLSFARLVSDPGGERFLGPLGLFDPEERDGIALPAILVIDPDGNEVYRYEGRDFADRTTDDDVYTALDGLGLEAIDPSPWDPRIDVPSELRGFFRPSDFGPYFRGTRSGATAIGMRLPSKETAAVAREHRQMAQASLDAWEIHEPTLG